MIQTTNPVDSIRLYGEDCTLFARCRKKQARREKEEETRGFAMWRKILEGLHAAPDLSGNPFRTLVERQRINGRWVLLPKFPLSPDHHVTDLMR